MLTQGIPTVSTLQNARRYQSPHLNLFKRLICITGSFRRSGSGACLHHVGVTENMQGSVGEGGRERGGVLLLARCFFTNARYQTGTELVAEDIMF